jgi:hypothetical protein
MKTIRSTIVIAGVAAILLAAWLVRTKKPQGPTPVALAPVPQATNTARTEPENIKPQHHPPQNLTNVKRANAFTDEEKKELAEKFKTKLRPAAEKWYLAYSNHIPFNLADLTLDKFVERIGANPSFQLYTFVLGDFTFTIQDNDKGAKVEYLMSRDDSRSFDASQSVRYHRHGEGRFRGAVQTE